MTVARERTMGLPPAAPPKNEGNTVAAWVTVAIVLIGGLVAALGVMASTAAGFWVGMGIVVVGLVVGKVLQLLGYGQRRRRD